MNDRRKRESFHRGRYQSIANQRSWPAVVVASLSPPFAPFFLRRPPSASHLIPPPRGQMGVPAYVKAALCSAHPRSAICQCQGASAVSMETPPASRQRRKRASEHERVNEPSGAVGDPPVLRDYHPAGTTQPPGFHHHRRSTARLPPFRPSSDTHPRGRHGACPRGKPPRFLVSPPSPMGAPQDAELLRVVGGGAVCGGSFSFLSCRRNWKGDQLPIHFRFCD